MTKTSTTSSTTSTTATTSTTSTSTTSSTTSTTTTTTTTSDTETTTTSTSSTATTTTTSTSTTSTTTTTTATSTTTSVTTTTTSSTSSTSTSTTSETTATTTTTSTTATTSTTSTTSSSSSSSTSATTTTTMTRRSVEDESARWLYKLAGTIGLAVTDGAAFKDSPQAWMALKYTILKLLQVDPETNVRMEMSGAGFLDHHKRRLQAADERIDVHFWITGEGEEELRGPAHNLASASRAVSTGLLRKELAGTSWQNSEVLHKSSHIEQPRLGLPFEDELAYVGGHPLWILGIALCCFVPACVTVLSRLCEGLGKRNEFNEVTQANPFTTARHFPLDNGRANSDVPYAEPLVSAKPRGQAMQQRSLLDDSLLDDDTNGRAHHARQDWLRTRNQDFRDVQDYALQEFEPLRRVESHRSGVSEAHSHVSYARYARGSGGPSTRPSSAHSAHSLVAARVVGGGIDAYRGHGQVPQAGAIRLAATPTTLFDQIDANHDGLIDRAEFERARAQDVINIQDDPLRDFRPVRSAAAVSGMSTPSFTSFHRAATRATATPSVLITPQRVSALPTHGHTTPMAPAAIVPARVLAGGIEALPGGGHGGYGGHSTPEAGGIMRVVPPRTSFDLIDTNHDGVIDRGEWARAGGQARGAAYYPYGNPGRTF
eukprot:TRINITY_DN3758_c0_g2_i1.p1 TRINITY_DN3758_c0_g2~~TRINITY_DN3758_c0_g2_i1.p1  ORF type:complete len:657 (+),score=94.25 TRINITY_DN3758_c0_g2_i1:187-2157(+)